MESLIYPYKLNDNYYQDVERFGDASIEYSSKFNLNTPLEGLMIGVYWEVFKEDALDLSDNIQQVLATLSKERNKSKNSKEVIDDIKGMILTKYLTNDKSKIDVKLDKTNFKLLLNYLEATGDFTYQLPHLNKDFTQEELDIFTTLATWFLKNSDKYLGAYNN